MTLREYLKENRITVKEFAQKVDVSRKDAVPVVHLDEEEEIDVSQIPF